MNYRIQSERPESFLNKYKDTYSTSFHNPLSRHVGSNTTLKTFITARKASDPEGSPVGWAILRKNKNQENNVFFERLARKYKTILPDHYTDAWGVYITAIQSVDTNEKGFVKKFIQSYASPTTLNGRPSASQGVGYYISEVTFNFISLNAHLNAGFVVHGVSSTGSILLIKYMRDNVAEAHHIKAAKLAFVGMQFGIIDDVEGVTTDKLKASKAHTSRFLTLFKDITMQRWEFYKQLYVGVGASKYIPITILAGNLAVTFAIAVFENFGVIIPPDEIKQAGGKVTEQELRTLWRRSANYGETMVRSIFRADTYDKTFDELLEILTKHMLNEYKKLDPICDDLSERPITNQNLLDKFTRCYTSMGEVASSRAGTAYVATGSYQNNMGIYGYLAFVQPQQHGRGTHVLYNWPGNCTVTALIMADILRFKELYEYRFRVFGRNTYANITKKLAALPTTNINFYEPRPGGDPGGEGNEGEEGWACHYGWEPIPAVKVSKNVRARSGNYNLYNIHGHHVMGAYKRKSQFNDRETVYDTITLNAFVRAIGRAEVGLQPRSRTAEILTLLRNEFLPRIRYNSTKRMVVYGAVNTS